MKVSKQSHMGISGKVRLGLEFLVAGIAAYLIMQSWTAALLLLADLFRSSRISCSILGHLLRALCRLRDGGCRQCGQPDRWARRARHRAGDGGPRGAFAVIAYLAGNVVFADYLQVHHTPGTGELSGGAGIRHRRRTGFSMVQRAARRHFYGRYRVACDGWADRHDRGRPAKHEIVLAIIGGLFSWSRPCRSSLQVTWFKLTGRRVFLMAPIHHHFREDRLDGKARS